MSREVGGGGYRALTSTSLSPASTWPTGPLDAVEPATSVRDEEPAAVRADPSRGLAVQIMVPSLAA